MKIRYRFMITALLILSLSPFTATAGGFCISPREKTKDDAVYKAINFSPWADLEPEQRNLLADYFGEREGIAYAHWIEEHNDQAAMFLALTHALEETAIDLGGGRASTALALVARVVEIKGDRLMAISNQDLIKAWTSAGGAYAIRLSKGRHEKGRVAFIDHSARMASLHCGFDIQGFTNPLRVPHLHWNVNLSNGLMDVHLDGYPSWYGGILPNPEHLSYENSDVRYWFENYLLKFGDPGFAVAGISDN